MVENAVGAHNFEKMHFCDVLFSLGANQILETRCIKQHAFVVDPLRDLSGVPSAPTLMFKDSQKGGSNQERGSKIRPRDGPASNFRSPGLPHGAHSDRKGAKTAARRAQG